VLRLLDNKVPGFLPKHARLSARLGLKPAGEQFLRTQMVTQAEMLDVGPHWDAWSAELRRIRDLSRGAGAEVLFVIFPIDWAIRQGWDASLPELTAFAEAEGIPLLDMIVFYRHDPARMLRDYTHPSRLGHQVAAREIERVIAAYLEGQSTPSGAAPTAHDHDG
jgi:hypothetical protein